MKRFIFRLFLIDIREDSPGLELSGIHCTERLFIDEFDHDVQQPSP